MCREPVPWKARNDQVGTRPRNVRDGTSNGVATTFLLRGSPRKERVLVRGPQETPIFSEGVGRGVEEHRRMRKALGRSQERQEKCGRHLEASKAKWKCKAVKRVEGALRKSAGRKAQGADEAGRVRIGSDEKGKFVIPTNQWSGMTARLGPSSQRGFGPRAGTGWRATQEAGQA